jgi:hypothetical protein
MRKNPMSCFAACLLLIPALLLGGAPAVFAGGTWADATRQFRLPVTAGGGGFDRSEKPAELPVNFTAALSSIGRSGSLDENSLRVVEVDAGGTVLNPDVPWQFDKDSDFNAASKASGTLVLIMKGTTLAAQDRYYHVYFALSGGGYTPASVTPQVAFTDNVQDAGQASYKIETAGGTYYYHKQGAGFSSWLDADGNDWLSFDPTPGSGGAGEYRGIPNSCYPEGHFHPGKTSASSTLISQGPLKVTYRSTTNDNLWQCVWEVFPQYARMTMVKADHPFWLLYEGTPGGSIEPSTDFMTFSDGTVKALTEIWTGELSGDEWVYFSDPYTGGSGLLHRFVLHTQRSYDRLGLRARQCDAVPDPHAEAHDHRADGRHWIRRLGKNDTRCLQTAHSFGGYARGTVCGRAGARESRERSDRDPDHGSAGVAECERCNGLRAAGDVRFFVRIGLRVQ